MNILFYLIPFLFCLFNYSNCVKCHRCASTDAVWNWVRYGLPVNQGDSMISDDNCLNEEKLKKDGDSCSGYCATINITRMEDQKTIAVVRDCYKKSIDLKQGDRPICNSSQKFVKRRSVNITTCYCFGNYCNGKGSSKAALSSQVLIDNSTDGLDNELSEEAFKFPWFIIHLTLISFLY